MDIPSHVKHRVLAIFSDATFLKIKNEVLFELFNDESDQIRKTASVLAVRAFTLKKLKVLLDAYVSSDAYRYYNVIHWLDLGVSMHRSDSKSIAKKAFG